MSLKPRKVPFAHIGSLVASLKFVFARVNNPDGSPSTTTACWAYLPSGFQVGYGASGCVNPDDYKQETGEKYAKERCIADATDKLWEFEGYCMKQTGRHSGEHV